MSQQPVKRSERVPGSSRIPEDSVFYTRLIPALLIGLGVLMVVLILFAAGVLVGWIQF